MYVLGVARNASPLERLQSKHKEFQKRMLCAAPPPLPPSTAPSTSTTRRTVLGSTTTPSARIAPSASLGDVFTAPALPAPASSSNGARMDVFVDASASARLPAGTAWPELGTRKTRVKENAPEVGTLAGSTLRQAGRARRAASGTGPAGAGSRIVPYRDPVQEERAEMPPPSVPASRAKAGAGAAPKTPARGLIVTYRDGDADEVETPATPGFTPFRDEVRLHSLPFFSLCIVEIPRFRILIAVHG